MNRRRTGNWPRLCVAFGLFVAILTPASAQQRLYDLAVPGRNVVDPHKTRADFLLAALAAQQTARREADLGKGTGLVTLAPGAKATFTDRDTQFRLEGFALLETTINSIAPPKSGGAGQRLFGVLRLTHPSGPGANVGFIIDYLRQGDGIVVNELTTLTVTPLKPRVSVLTLPAGELPRILARGSGRFVPLFEAVSREGKPLPLAAPGAKSATTVVVLGADRLLPGDRIEATFTDLAGRPLAGLPPSQASQVGGFVLVTQDFPNGLVPGRVAVTHVTDLHPNATNGRQVLGTKALVADSAPQAAPAAPQAAGGWRLDDDANPTQLSFSTPARADDPELLIACDRPNNELHVLYRKLASDDAEAASDRLDTLNAAVTGAGTPLTLPGFVSRAPEATAVGYDILVTDNSIAALSAPDLAWTLPGMTIAAPLSAAAAQFVQSCPKVGTATESMTWRRRINLAAGYAIDLPLGFFRLASADRSGRFYRGGPGNGTLQVSNVVNQDDMTPREALKRMTQDEDVVTKVTKSAAGKDSLTITGTRGSRAVFVKAILTCEKSQWAIVRLEYDAGARGEVDPLIGRIDQSFTPQGALDGLNACE